jgi:hypothetical protein
MSAVGFAPAFAQTSAIVSDDFNRFRFDEDVWTVANPTQTSEFRLVGTNTSDAWLEIDVPGGANQDVWFTGLNAPRLMQGVRNTDFQVEVRFESSVDAQGQSQGILVEQDAGNYLKVYFTVLNGQTTLFAAGATNFQLNQNDPYLNTPIAPPGVGPLWLRLTRVQNEWTASYSLDGAEFTDAEPFAHRVAMAKIGLYAGVFNFLADAPAFKLVADYFLNTAAPFSGEDSTIIEDVYAPLIVETDWLPYDNRIVLNWDTDEPSTAIVEYGLTTDLELGSVSLNDVTSTHSVELPNLSLDTEYIVRFALSDSLGNEALSESYTITTLAAPPTNPVIRLWYGDLQQFGNLGIAQRWVNVLGTVEDADLGDRVTMAYSVNDGEDIPLRVGADRRRLAGTGDFNIEIPIEGLRDGENVIILKATDRYGNRVNTSASVFYSNFNIWGLPYTIDWSQVQNIQAAVQVVDGKWELTSTGLRTAEAGYRRMFALGDISWTDYEIVADFAVNGLTPPTGDPAIIPDAEPFVGIITRWTGYYAWDNVRPALGPFPVGAFGRFIWRSAVQTAGARDNVELLDSFLNPAATDSSALQVLPGETYRIRMRTVTAVDGSSFYSVRVWRSDIEEPSWWNIATAVPEGGNTAGSVALVANRADVTFGNIEINRLTPDAYLVQTYDNTPPECAVTVNSGGANLRANAGPNFGLVRSLAGGTELLVNGQQVGPDGQVWYRAAEDGAWLRADLVTRNEDCDVSAIISLDPSGS